MFIEADASSERTPSGVPCPSDHIVHFTPDGVRRHVSSLTINITLLTEGEPN